MRKQDQSRRAHGTPLVCRDKKNNNTKTVCDTVKNLLSNIPPAHELIPQQLMISGVIHEQYEFQCFYFNHSTFCVFCVEKLWGVTMLVDEGMKMIL